jgi:hypothetical protein
LDEQIEGLSEWMVGQDRRFSIHLKIRIYQTAPLMTRFANLRTLLIALLLIIALAPAKAQDSLQPASRFNLGIMVGLNSSYETINYFFNTPNRSQSDKRFNYEASMRVEYWFLKHWGLSSGLCYDRYCNELSLYQNGVRSTYQFDDIYTITQVQIPLYLCKSWEDGTVKLLTSIGVEGAFFLSSKDESTVTYISYGNGYVDPYCDGRYLINENINQHFNVFVGARIGIRKDISKYFSLSLEAAYKTSAFGGSGEASTGKTSVNLKSSSLNAGLIYRFNKKG